MNKHIPDIGELAPDFTIEDADGNPFHLEQALTRTTYLMLVFYRGHW